MARLKGFSLIEILAATAIFAGTMVLTVGIFSLTAASESAFSTKRLVNQSAQLAVDAVAREAALSANQYDDNDRVSAGKGAFFIAQFAGKNDSEISYIDNIYDSDARIVNQMIGEQLKEITGNVLLIRTLDETSQWVMKAFYLCPHKSDPNPTNPNAFNFGFKKLSAADFSDDVFKSTIQQEVNCDLDSGWQPLLNHEVKVASPSDLKISGIFPEQGLTAQPHLTISLTASNTFGDKPWEKTAITFRQTASHSDYRLNNLRSK